MIWQPWRHLGKKLLTLLTLTALVAILVWWRQDAADQTSKTSEKVASGSQNTITVTSSFDKSKYSSDQASSLWAVVNKGRALPPSYVPAELRVPKVTLNGTAASENMHLRSDAASVLETMAAAAADDGLKLTLVSGYRSYPTQQSVYSGYVSSQGQTEADKTSARPGHSEHQTGLAADLGAASGRCQLEKCFGDMAEGQWLTANAYKFGFIVRYENGKESLTGYTYEPWHLRYVGQQAAAEIKKTGQSLEQFFNLPPIANYSSDIYQLY